MAELLRTDEKLKTSTKWFFALGDIYQGGFFNIVNFFYSIFLTDVIGLSPIWAANVFLVGKVWDAVIDPLMGTITDNTRTRWGRRRPYFLIGAPLIFVGFVVMWFPLSSGTEVAKIVFFIFAYMLMNTVNAIVSVPFLAMSAELSTDYNERTSITNARMIVSIISSIICAVVPMLIVGMFKDIYTGYLVMGVVFGLFFSLPMLIVFFKVPERKQFSEGEKSSIKEMFAALKVKVFRRFIVMYLCIVVAMDVISMIFAYYMTYNLGRPAELSFVLGTLLIAQVLTVPLASAFAKRTSKTNAVILGGSGWIICGIASMFIAQTSPGFAIYLLAAVLGFFMAFALIGYTSLFGDVTDVGEYYFKRRVEGSFAGIQQFIRKCAAALANWIALTLLGLSGFINPIEDMVDGAAVMVAQTQSPEVLFTIKAILGISCLVLLIPAIIIAARWKLSKSRHALLIDYLDRRRSGLEVSAAEEQEVVEAMKPLV